MTDRQADKGRVRLGLLISVAVLAVAVGSWFVYREFGAPSFRRYERRFRSAYSEYLRQEIARRSADEQKVLGTPDYQKLDASLKGQSDKDAQAKRDQFIKSKLPGQTVSELQGVLRNVQNMETKPREWSLKPAGGGVGYVAGPGLIDRCQSCHLGDDPSLVPAGMTLTKAALGMDGNKDAPFASHPEPELLAIHPPEKFGCSSCHGGNGTATQSVESAHGQDGKWPIPLYTPENYEAGCQRCHAGDMITQDAPVLSRGRELFRRNGCTACHVYQGFDHENETGEVRQVLAQLQSDRRAKLDQIARLNKAGDTAKDNATARRDYQEVADLTLAVSNIDAQTSDLQRRTSQTRQVADKIGPDLSEVRVKLVKEWIPYWLSHTREYRPGTKMPQFPFKPGEAEAIAAFVWQAGVESSPALPKRLPGSPARGQELFESRGCLGCHSIGEGDSKMGGTFAGNLSREGEKANYDWVV